MKILQLFSRLSLWNKIAVCGSIASLIGIPLALTLHYAPANGGQEKIIPAQPSESKSQNATVNNARDVTINQNINLDEKKELRPASLKVVEVLANPSRSMNPVLDIKLLNNSDETIFLTQITAVVIERHPYTAMVPPSAEYDLLIASGRNTLNLSHSLKPNEVDRMIIKLGATRYNSACYFKMKLEFNYNGDKKIESDPFGVSFID